MANSRWQLIRTIHNDYRGFYQLFGASSLILLGIIIGATLFGEDGYITNLYTEFLGIAVTIMIFDRIVKLNERRELTRDRQQQLLIDAGSSSNHTAKRALDEMWRRGWWGEEDGLMKSAFMYGADWSDAKLGDADLRNVTLAQAKLINTDLRRVDLRGVDLRDTDISGALIWQTICDENTILPNHEKWCSNVDLLMLGARFYPPEQNIWFNTFHVIEQIDAQVIQQERESLIREIIQLSDEIDIDKIAPIFSISTEELSKQIQKIELES